MKSKILLSLCILTTVYLSSAQNLQWSKKITQPKICQSKGLLTDASGNVYSYGSLTLDPNQDGIPPDLTDTSGSFLQGYSSNGTILFSKRWAIPFFIEKMEYDGNQYFYFAATFVGTQIIDGIAIVSQGNTDGITGKMDLNGNIIWMKTFGGIGVDRANGICFNSNDNSIYSTGNIRDDLFLNNAFESTNQQSALIIHYSASGTLVNYRLYDFVPERDLGNINAGREICTGQGGDFFLLMDRDGVNWNGPDTVAGPIMGRYVIKLNSNLDTVWTSYITGPACYYGWSCNSLRAAMNGDVYIASYCSSHYGGTGALSRLNGNTGQISWNYYNTDGAYTDLIIDVNTVFMIGNEGADGCPCPTNNGGYYIIKKFDENNILLGETRFSAVYLKHIAKDISGNLFVTGDFFQNMVIIGQDTIIGVPTPNFGHPYYGRTLTKLSDVNCTAPVISVSVASSYGHFYPLCSGSTADLTVNLTTGTFDWSNGTTGTQTTITSTGLYTVMNTQSNGCHAYSLPVDIQVYGTIPGTISGNSAVCAGDSTTYSIIPVNGATSYSWILPSGWTGSSNNTSIHTIAGTASGNITVTETSICGTSAPQTLSVTVSQTAPGTLSVISGNTSVCSESSNTYSIIAVTDATSYSWTLPLTWTGTSTANSITANSSITGGNISVTAENGCGSSAAQTTSVSVISIDTSVTRTGLTFTANMSGVAYQWFNCNNNVPLSGETNQSFTVTVTGDYAVILTKNGCIDTSACNNIMTTGITDNSQNVNLSIYPNPIDDIVYINYKSNVTSGSFQLVIKNILGQDISKSIVTSFQGEYKNAIDLSKEAPGNYFVQIITENKTIVKKISVY